MQMVIGEQTQQVVVNAAPPIMQTDSASLGTVVEGKAVQTLALNGRNVLNLGGSGARSSAAGWRFYQPERSERIRSRQLPDRRRQRQSVRGAGRWCVR